MFDNNDDANKHGMIDHNDIHKNLMNHPDTKHEDIHDHDKIHEAMHLGSDNISNPMNPHI